MNQTQDLPNDDLELIKKEANDFISKHKSKYEVINVYQDYLNQLTSSTYSEAIEFIENHKNIFFKDKQSVLFFMYSLLDCSVNNFRNLEIVLDVCIHFSNEIKSFEKNMIELELSALCMMIPNSLWYLYSKGFFSIETIISKSIQDDFFFCNFLPEIEQYDKQFADKRKKRFLSNINEKNNEFIKPFYETVISDYSQHILNRQLNYHPSLLHKAIREDDIDTFQSIISKNNIGINNKIPFSYYERTKTIDRNLEPIKVASLYGSVKVFKFLLMNNAELDKNILSYIYFGSNLEIIHLIENKCSHKDAFIQPIITHKSELFDYYIENFSDKIVEENTEVQKLLNDFVYDEDDDVLCRTLNYECLHGCLYSYNYPIIESCLKKIIFIARNYEMISHNQKLRESYFLHETEFDLDLFKFIYSLIRPEVNKYKSNCFLSFFYLKKNIVSNEAYKYLFWEFIDYIDSSYIFEKSIRYNFQMAIYLLDCQIKERNKTILNLSQKLVESYFTLALVFYNEEIIVKMAQYYDLLDTNEKLKRFAYFLREIISDKMLVSLIDKLGEFLSLSKLNYIQQIFNEH